MRRIVFNDALRFENMVFLALQRRYRDVYYLDDDGVRGILKTYQLKLKIYIN